MAPRTSRGPLTGLAAAVAAGLVCVGAGVGWLLNAAAQPATTRASDPVTAVPVTTQPYADARPVALTLLRGAEQKVLSRTGGTVTASSCSVGVPLASGSAPFAIDGRRALALHTATPWWRPLTPGVRGADVEALHAELGRLGQPVTGDTITGTTTAALDAVGRAAGIDGVTLDSLVWLPDAASAPTTCPALGSAVAAGEPLATLAPGLTGAHVGNLPADAAPGPRVVVVDGERFALTERLDLRAEDLPRLLAAPSFTALAADPAATLPANAVLAEPVEALVVPAAAIGEVSGDRSCVVGDAGAVPVRVVGSQLGRTFVVVDGAAPKTVSVDPQRPRRCT